MRAVPIRCTVKSSSVAGSFWSSSIARKVVDRVGDVEVREGQHDLLGAHREVQLREAFDAREEALVVIRRDVVVRVGHAEQAACHASGRESSTSTPLITIWL